MRKPTPGNSLLKLRSHKLLRALGARGVVTLGLGAALSVGGVSQVMQNVHFVVRKDLDSVRVVKQEGSHAEVVARLEDGFAADSVFKLSRALPDRFVTRQIALFNEAWLPEQQPATSDGQPGLFSSVHRLNDAIRREFFANSVPYGSTIHEKAQKYGVDPALVAAVVETESRFRPNARSRVGARGLMQLMPRTGRWLGASNLNDPEQNLDAGVKYIKYLQGRFDGNLKKTIAAYNAGEGNVKRYNGVPPFHETRSYVNKVMSRYAKRNDQLKSYASDNPDTPPTR